MALIEIPTLAGGIAHVAADNVYKVGRNWDSHGGSGLTEILMPEDRQLTRLNIDVIAKLIIGGGGKLVKLTAPDGTPVYLNIKMISVIRPADIHQDPIEAKSYLRVAGHREAVREETQQVVDAMQHA